VERGRLALIYIIAYDIADNKRRLRVAKTLESWCYRIQESVFQLRLDAATLARVRMSLAALISDAEDVIHIYPICTSCADPPPPPPPAPPPPRRPRRSVSFAP